MSPTEASIEACKTTLELLEKITVSGIEDAVKLVKCVNFIQSLEDSLNEPAEKEAAAE